MMPAVHESARLPPGKKAQLYSRISLFALLSSFAGVAPQARDSAPYVLKLDSTIRVRADQVAFGSDGQKLLIMSRGRVSEWTIRGRRVRTFGARGLGESMAVSKDGRWVACAGKRLTLTDLRSGRLRILRTPLFEEYDQSTLMFSHDSKLFAAQVKGRMWLWRVPEARPYLKLRTTSSASYAKLSEITVTRPAFFPDGRHVIVAHEELYHGNPMSYGIFLDVFDLRGRRTHSINLDETHGNVESIVVSGDGKWIAVAYGNFAMDFEVDLVAPRRRKLMTEDCGQQNLDCPGGLAFLGRGDWILVPRPYSFWLSNRATARLVKLVEYAPRINAMSLSRDQSRMAVELEDGRVLVYRFSRKVH